MNGANIERRLTHTPNQHLSLWRNWKMFYKVWMDVVIIIIITNHELRQTMTTFHQSLYFGSHAQQWLIQFATRTITKGKLPRIWRKPKIIVSQSWARIYIKQQATYQYPCYLLQGTGAPYTSARISGSWKHPQCWTGQFPFPQHPRSDSGSYNIYRKMVLK